MSAENGMASKIFSEVRKCLENGGTTDSAASRCLYVLNMASSLLGRDAPEEAESFKSQWEEIKPSIEKSADKGEFLNNSKMIEEAIGQILSPEKHPYVTHRGESLLNQKGESILVYLN